MNNIIYEILGATDNVSFYKRRLYLLNREALKYVERRKVADKELITDLPSAIFEAVVDIDCKLCLNWLHFLFGADIYELSFASFSITRNISFIISDLNKIKFYDDNIIMEYKRKNTGFDIGIRTDLKNNMFMYLKRQS